MSKTNTFSVDVPDGQEPVPGKTDWDRLRRMTEAEAEAAALADPDAQPLSAGALSTGRFGRRVRLLRERMGLSQQAFASAFHIPVGTVRDWEQGRGTPDATARAFITLVEHDPEAARRALAA
ncbi:helix-turn-helix domain-containing protein [Aerophototrophica crusticola]|uniref:Helix-turn-helix domain-containing protein n=1 Tax=Aerophototrophica crusticola TaxID=1709002 RepID=A0A858R3H1_9PROT|nr:helix-turn-helix domain-containing protein [Rhodospirillaceae bacterium B3]